MSRPDFEGARQYAIDCLEHQLPTQLWYHSPAHTCDDVAPAVERLAALEQIVDDELLLLRTGAYYHDLGYISRRAGHEEVSVAIARSVLPGFGYTVSQIDQVAGMIIATQLPQTPHNLLERILADADLDLLGREDFWRLSHALRAELAVHEGALSDVTWYRRQVAFLQSHRYWTASARLLREAQKQRHIAALEALIELGIGD
jgi:uncharacterized protein